MLSLYPAFPEDFDTDTPLVVTIDGLDVPLYCDRFERRGVSGAAAAFADFDPERRAQELLGLDFRIAPADGAEHAFSPEDLLRFPLEPEAAGSAARRSGLLPAYTHSPPPPPL